MKVNFLEPHFNHLRTLITDRGWTTMDSYTMETLANYADCEFFHGVSKGCFLNPNWDFVIKIPYYGYHASKNYCAEEEIAYLEIKEKYPLCSKLFAETEYLDTWGEIPVYIQEKVFCSADELWFDNSAKFNAFLAYAYKQPQQFENDFSTIRQSRLNKMFCGAVIQTYGYKVFEILRNWIIDTNQTDLHSSNVGFTKDFRPIIFDFSNWEDYSQDSASP